jgi:transcriptional regulator with XRE-family HTH domain
MYSHPVPKPWAAVAGNTERTEKAAAELRDRRLARELTQEAFAKELGVIANTVAGWERGEVPIPHWVAPYLDLKRKVAELTSALAEAQEKLRATIETKNFDLQVEKATRKSLRVTPTADKLHYALCKSFWQDRTTLLKINEIYLGLTRPSKTIDEELYGADNKPRSPAIVVANTKRAP